jgi:hypothetical protein
MDRADILLHEQESHQWGFLSDDRHCKQKPVEASPRDVKEPIAAEHYRRRPQPFAESKT